jgi:hypothetical protein
MNPDPNPYPNPVCSQRSDPDPVQIGPDPQHWVPDTIHLLVRQKREP